MLQIIVTRVSVLFALKCPICCFMPQVRVIQDTRRLREHAKVYTVDVEVKMAPTEEIPAHLLQG